MLKTSVHRRRNLLIQSCCAILVVTLAMAAQERSGFAQAPERAAPEVSSAVRQRLRRAILDIAMPSDAEYSNVRSQLALPLAQLGDWDGALRLLEKDMNAPQNSDELWHWRAYQLARAGKWREVPDAAAHIRSTPTRADTLLFAARTMIERGIVLHGSNADSPMLQRLLSAATTLLGKPEDYSQLSYAAYLWRRGGDFEAAQRVFARALQNARHSAQTEKPRVFQNKGKRHEMRRHDRAVQGVLMMQARAGLMQAVLRNFADLDDFNISWLPSLARTRSDLQAVTAHIKKLPAERQLSHLFGVSTAYSVRGDKAQARHWFNEARRLATKVAEQKPDSDSKKSRNAQIVAAMSAFYAAHFLRDAELEAATLNELKALAANYPVPEMRPEVLEIMPEFLDLNARSRMGLPLPLPTPARIDEIARKLENAAPSDLQFRALETVAGYYVFYQREDRLKPVAEAMLQTARSLAPAEMKERNEKGTVFNPYWPRTPRMLNAIFWLQRAGDQATAATFAREFARTTFARERPYAAMSLTQLGFFALADSLFDPAVEYPRIVAKRKADWKRNHVDWSLFMSWDEFAANEARYRAPDAPFRWIGHVDNINTRAQILRAWIGALYPEPRLNPPFVQVSGDASRASM
jgi:tetratricopeptide (TPR) repeat protein